jgi:hypothetical protein
MRITPGAKVDRDYRLIIDKPKKFVAGFTDYLIASEINGYAVQSLEDYIESLLTEAEAKRLASRHGFRRRTARNDNETTIEHVQ